MGSIWMALPKYLCWKIQIDMNKAIFNSKIIPSIRTAIKAKQLMVEAMVSRGIVGLYHEILSSKERHQVNDFLLGSTPQSKSFSSLLILPLGVQSFQRQNLKNGLNHNDAINYSSKVPLRGTLGWKVQGVVLLGSDGKEEINFH